MCAAEFTRAAYRTSTSSRSLRTLRAKRLGRLFRLPSVSLPSYAPHFARAHAPNSPQPWHCRTEYAPAMACVLASRRSPDNRARPAQPPSSAAYAAIAARSFPRSPNCRRGDRSRRENRHRARSAAPVASSCRSSRPARSAASRYPRPAASVFDPLRGKPGRQRIDRAAHFVKLANALGIELRDFEARAAAFGEQALPVQQMQRVRNGLARDAELFSKFILTDALSRRQRAVDDGFEKARIDLIDQIWRRHPAESSTMRLWNTEFCELPECQLTPLDRSSGCVGSPWERCWWRKFLSGIRVDRNNLQA